MNLKNEIRTDKYHPCQCCHCVSDFALKTYFSISMQKNRHMGRQSMSVCFLLTSSTVGTLFPAACKAIHRAESALHALLSRTCSSIKFRCFTMSLDRPSSERINTSITCTHTHNKSSYSHTQLGNITADTSFVWVFFAASYNMITVNCQPQNVSAWATKWNPISEMTSQAVSI